VWSKGKSLLAVVLQLMSMAVFAEQNSVNAVLYSTTPNLLRMTFDVTASPKHRVFVLDNPPRLVIDIKEARLGRQLGQPSPSHPLFSRVRAGGKNESDLRVVVDLKKAVSAKTFSLSSNNSNERRLVVDLIDKGSGYASIDQRRAVKTVVKSAESDKKVAARPASETPVKSKARSNPSAEAKTVDKSARAIVIAVDAGHGGNDPGARGPQGTLEKKVTFTIAKKLAALINAHSGMKAVMVRKGDYYVGLRKRMQIARAAKADLFISIHADAFHNAGVRGASVYTLSRNGASSEAARWLANNENAADLIGGISLDDKEDVLASVLLDLSQTATQEASVNAAGHVLRNFQDVCELHKGSVQKAGFMVLKSPDMPSILVETAFISNPLEERNLLSASYQSKIAKAIFRGVRNYFKQAAPVDSRMAAL
jgi:N-acetylmuramoyl-L-alanine amidase